MTRLALLKYVEDVNKRYMKMTMARTRDTICMRMARRRVSSPVILAILLHVALCYILGDLCACLMLQKPKAHVRTAESMFLCCR